MEIDLKGDQNEMKALTALTEDEHKGDLEAVYDEANSKEESIGETVREIWNQDIKDRCDSYGPLPSYLRYSLQQISISLMKEKSISLTTDI